MAKLFYTNIDLKGNQLLNGVIHSATAAPTALRAGQVYYNTNDKLMYQYDGTKWVVVGGSVADLETDVTKVVTGSTTSNGTATLATTNLRDMKVGVGLANLTNVTAETTVSGEFQAIDTALQEVKTTYVKAGSTYTSGDILVAGASDGINNASTTGYSIETTLDPTHSTKIPTSEAVATYIGSLAGGINYRGTIGASPATVQSLPTTGVKVGDAYAVTTAGTYDPLNEPSDVGDLIICNGTSPISWTNVPINFTVEDKQLRNFAPASGEQTIAVVDGKNITMSLQAITTGTSGEGDFVTGVSADDNNKLTITKGKALTTVNSTSAGTGVVTSVVKNSNNTTIDVTYTDLTVAASTGIQYVTSVSQASNGQVTVSGTNFDGSIPTTSPSTSNAPTTNAVKTYVDGLIDGLDGDATIALVANGIVTLKAGVVETDGKIENSTGDDITLAKVATTGNASDVSTTEIRAQDEQTIIVPAGNVQDSLQHIARELNAAIAGSVASFGGQTGVITVGNGLTMGTGATAKEVSAMVDGYIVNNAGTGNNALDIDSAKVDKTYSVSNVNNLATVATVKTAIEGLDVNDIEGFGAGKTLATLTETDGKIAATFQDISITSSQISDKTDTYSADGTVAVTGKAVKAALETLDVTAFALSAGGTTSIDVYGISETDGKITADTTTNKATWNFDGTYNANTNKIALQSTVTGVVDALDGSHNVVAIGDYEAGTGEFATKKIEFFDGTQTNGLLGTSSSASDTLYITKAVSPSDPLIVKSDLSGIVGAMVYKGAVNANTDLPTTDVQAGWTYVVGTAGTYAGQACEVGDMIIAKDSTPTWNIINGENQVTDAGATITAGASSATTIATVDGTNLTAKVEVTGGTATIASVSNNVVTIKTGVTQTGTTGTIENTTGTDIVLDDVAVTGAANELTVTSATYGGNSETTNAQTALNNLAAAITNASITIDGFKGAITTGNGITDVTADGGSFGIKIDSTNANGLSVDANGLALAKATGTTFGAVAVTAGNGLTLTDGVVAYAHNTSAITVASQSGKAITINGTLTPNASDAITPSNAITLADVAATGAASDVTYSATIGGTAVTNVDAALDALNELSGNAVYVYKGALTFSSNTASITIAGADLVNSAITEIRDNTNNVVECDVQYTGATTMTITANGNPTGLYAIVHYKKAQQA
ncbi:MAG: hypothetical protein IKO56_10450 [Alphaproteobacteria bacterium]|nr:hypothetical protein [Alphaproteobacteria bacterium]